ncbi:hypothetical protein F0562_028978 [Nyssa sinensis]|uniref:Complex III subunit VI n=1 Tax=Nyssa sinensis TaxID=561372 RepID=A0A5J5B1S6_9ASTE|nr:hypothetical protein F0562_028978 [Nyssa sinensis]
MSGPPPSPCSLLQVNGERARQARSLLAVCVFSSIAMADEEPVDQKKHFEEACKPKCVKPLLEYQACIKRIQGDESGHKHCTGQYFDYWSCVDKCAAPKVFSALK